MGVIESYLRFWGATPRPTATAMVPAGRTMAALHRYRQMVTLCELWQSTERLLLPP
ncbi:hypothetical protein GCM10022254_72350 [Actinomadura meridiana]|uniref:Uncharacterized protein n=1 Tax=Actinomadura meridiana TaxID=559626 RepID=A0ABP8CPY7_9ACTN